jgi:hypothetical protein
VAHCALPKNSFEVASLCVYLASEQAANAGAALRVDGGVPDTVF